MLVRKKSTIFVGKLLHYLRKRRLKSLHYIGEEIGCFLKRLIRSRVFSLCVWLLNFLCEKHMLAPIHLKLVTQLRAVESNGINSAILYISTQKENPPSSIGLTFHRKVGIGLACSINFNKTLGVLPEGGLICNGLLRYCKPGIGNRCALLFQATFPQW